MAFYDFMQKLVFARQIKFNKGSIELLNKNVVLLNASFFSNYVEKINNNPKLVQDFYYSVKDSFGNDFAEGIGKKYNFKFRDFVEWMLQLAMMTGWGTFTWEKLKEADYEGVIIVEKSPIAINLKNKVKFPVDHAIRGFIAGGATAAFKKDIDVIEEKCYALGEKKCKFILKLSKNFDKSDNLVKNQLGK